MHSHNKQNKNASYFVDVTHAQIYILFILTDFPTRGKEGERERAREKRILRQMLETISATD